VVKRAPKGSSILIKPIETWSYFRPKSSKNPEIPPPYSLNFLSLSYPLIFHLFKFMKRGAPSIPASKLLLRLATRIAQNSSPGRRCRLLGVPPHTAGRRGIAPPAGARKPDNADMPRRVCRLRRARRPSGPASGKPLIAGARAIAPVAKIEMRWPERTVMNVLKVYVSPLIQDMQFRTKRPTMHCNPITDMLAGRGSQTATGDHGPEQENSRPPFPPTTLAAGGVLALPARNCGGRRSPSPHDPPTRAKFPSFLI
jgi:hypothetical protein